MGNLQHHLQHQLIPVIHLAKLLPDCQEGLGGAFCSSRTQAADHNDLCQRILWKSLFVAVLSILCQAVLQLLQDGQPVIQAAIGGNGSGKTNPFLVKQFPFKKPGALPHIFNHLLSPGINWDEDGWEGFTGFRHKFSLLGWLRIRPDWETSRGE